MKKFINENKKILIIGLIIILIIILVIVILLSIGGKDKGKGNSYNFSNSIDELPGTKEYTNKELKSSHCLDDVCIENATFYYLEDSGRVDYYIYNKSDKTVSGYLKMQFKDDSLVVIYSDLEPKTRIKTSSQYEGADIKYKKDFKLKKLTDKEINEIVEEK